MCQQQGLARHSVSIFHLKTLQAFLNPVILQLLEKSFESFCRQQSVFLHTGGVLIKKDFFVCNQKYKRSHSDIRSVIYYFSTKRIDRLETKAISFLHMYIFVSSFQKRDAIHEWFSKFFYS
jgi:hypothetical protein